MQQQFIFAHNPRPLQRDFTAIARYRLLRSAVARLKDGIKAGLL